MDYLSKLENQSIYILREAFNKFENLAMLWSIGKDSTVMLWPIPGDGTCRNSGAAAPGSGREPMCSTARVYAPAAFPPPLKTLASKRAAARPLT